MAIKFSQFVVRTNSSDLSHIVGYNGVDNIQITPTNFLNSALTGTAGQVLFYDTTGVAGDNDLYWDNTNKRLGVGNSNPIQKLHVTGTARISGTNNLDIFSDNTAATFNLASNARGFLFKNLNGDLVTINSSGNVGIGTTSPGEKLEVNGNIKVGDSEQFIAGSNNDLRITHDGTDSFINSNGSGDLYIQQFNDDKDIIFKSDDGSGGMATYFSVDGGGTDVNFFKDTHHIDNVKAKFGSASTGDLQIFHDGSGSKVENYTGNLTIQQRADDSDIVFQCDDGSGGITDYFRLDGGVAHCYFSKSVILEDSVELKIGSGNDLNLFHDGTDSFIRNQNTGDLYIQQKADNKGIIFQSDDGSGGITEYFRVDGANEVISFTKQPKLFDNVTLNIGNASDLRIYHNSTNSLIDNINGDLSIRQLANDKDIRFRCDDGSGGETDYFVVDGGLVANIFYKRIKLIDNVQLQVGSNPDLLIYHDTSNSYIQADGTGDLVIEQKTDDKNILFKSDDGSGGVTTYFELDGNNVLNKFRQNLYLLDNIGLKIGNSFDLDIKHDGSDSYIQNATGDLYIKNSSDNKGIIFQSDDGSGGVTTYFQLDGANEVNKFSKHAQFLDSIEAKFGNGGDLRIYHNGSNSYIDDSGTGDLRIRSNFVTIEKYNNGEIMASFNDDNAVSLYFNNSKKFETTTTGIKITGVSEYADNTAAIAAGLTTGDVYRTGDLLKIVH